MKTKPRHHICWHCLLKLRGNHHVERMVDGHMRILHKSCADEIKEDPDYYRLEVTAMPKED